MNCLNSGNYLREAIDSVYSQTYQNWEIILWDNASSEDIYSILKDYDNRLIYFRGNKTVSLGEARNLALEKSTGDLIAFLDCDDIWDIEKLQYSIPFFRDPEIGVVYTDWILFNSSGYSQCKYGDKNAPSGNVFEKILFNNFTCLSTLLVRSIVIKSGLIFDSRFTYLEDTDFLIQIAREWKFWYVKKPLTKYRMHANSISANKVDGFRKEMTLLIDKYCSLYPDVKIKYYNKLVAVNAKDSAIDNWRIGDSRTARLLMKPNIYRSFKYFIIYIIMFFPFSSVDWLRKKIFRIVEYRY